MKLPFPTFLALALALPLAVSAQTPTIAPATVLSDFEVAPVFKASQILDAETLQGDHHRVAEDVPTSGYTNTYTINSDFGTFIANGDLMLPERLREIYAIAGLRKTQTTDAYGDALGNAVKAPIKGAENLVKDPGGTLKGMGKGAARFFKGAAERVKTSTSDHEAAEGMRQYSEAWRNLAGQYGVDPYTSNPVLKEELNKVAMAGSAGSLTFTVVKLVVPGAAGAALAGVSASSDLNEILVSKGPYQLRVDNRKALESMGVSDSMIDAFLNHQTLTTRHQTVITGALSQLAGVRGKPDYIRMALAARSEEDALFFQRNAELMILFHRHRAPVSAIVNFYDIPAILSTDGRLVLPLQIDYGSWTEMGSRFVDSLMAFTLPGQNITSREFFISGQLSDRAREESAKLGLIVTEDAYQFRK